MTPPILLVAGEASGDAHAAAVLLALRDQQPQLAAFGVGGRACREAGMEVLVPAEDMSLAGLTEVLWALPRMARYMRLLVAACKERRPRVAVLVDLPDFNLRLAKKLKALGVHVIYYVSPQVWAWRAGRVETIRQVVDEMLVILPFEEAFYRSKNVPARFVGHPLVEAMDAHGGVPSREEARRRLQLGQASEDVVALLPGSRGKEVARLLPQMLAGAARLHGAHLAQAQGARQQVGSLTDAQGAQGAHSRMDELAGAPALCQQPDAGAESAGPEAPRLRFVVPVASTLVLKDVARLVAASKLPPSMSVTLVDGRSTEVLAACDAAVVCSGTATLQAALVGRPMVVVYRVSWLSFFILRRLVKVAHVGLVNLVAGERLVPELLQKAANGERIALELEAMLRPGPRQNYILQKMRGLRAKLSERRAAHQVAGAILASSHAAARQVHP